MWCGLLHTKHRAQLITFHDFDLEQPSRHTFEEIATLAENAPRRAMRVTHDAFDLSVDQSRGVLGVRTSLWTDRDVEEATALGVVVVNGAERVAHAPFGDHRARDIGGALQIVLRTRGDLAQCEFLRGASAEQNGELRKEFAAL